MAISSITARVLFSPPSPKDGFLPEGPRLFSLAGRPTLGWVNIQHSSEATAGVPKVSAAGPSCAT